MASLKVKKIGEHKAEVQAPHNNAWEVMKPFVHFGIKATGLIAGTLATIIRNIPKPEAYQKNSQKDNKIMKI